MSPSRPAKPRPSAIVTGAGSGLGAAIARRLVAQGYHVVAVGRRPTPLADLQADLGVEFVTPRPLDATDTASLTALVNEVAAQFGPLHVVVNNAGIAQQVAIADTSPEIFAETIAVNLAAPAAVIAAAWPHFMAQEAGCIINVSSLAQFDPFPGFFAYAASKAGLHLLTVVAHNEGAASGIRAFTIAPGVIDTDLHRRLMPEGVPPEMRHSPEQVALVVGECVAGEHDAYRGSTLAVVADGVAPFVREWIAAQIGRAHV